ncbi:MAG TPA: UDP-N-acetylmuramate dehydrogenase [Chloroflexota bacterium]|nr:UDP-N-acetylmuramate dehydrogenase [Chloroflexota bacterium]
MSKHVFEVPARHLHFVGVGGIGMSGLAKILLEDGYTVSGSDLSLNRNTDELQALGGHIFQGHRAEQAEGAELIVVTSAAAADNPEVRWGLEHGVPVAKRAVFLGQLMGQKWGVAVSGTHGKTTTTAMVATILLNAGLDPTVACGGDLLATGSNARLGRGPHFVAEADEFDRSFLQFPAKTKVITNIEADHLDLYGTMDALIEAFHEFAASGTVVLNGEDPHTTAIAREIGPRAVTFTASEGAPPGLRLAVPGQHNVANALAALEVAELIGVDRGAAIEALNGFLGTRRRLQTIGCAAGVEVIDDYAHHPTEIRASLRALKERRPSRLICVFQPHLYARTKDLFEEFTDAFGDADELIVVDTYSPAGREEAREVTSEDLARATGARYVPALEEAAAAVQAPAGSVVVAMGAGTITRLPNLLLERLRGEQILEVLGPRVEANFPLAKLTSFKVGGPADFFAAVRSEDEMVRLVGAAWQLGLPVFILGNGSNILLADKGIRGLVIRNLCVTVEYREVPHPNPVPDGEGTLHIEAQSGAMLPRVGHEAIKRGYYDLVYATGIPGSVGGAVMSNAGAYGWCMADSLSWVRFLARDGAVQTLPVDACELRYRHSRFKDTGEIVLAAGFDLHQRQETAKAGELNRKRRDTQPLTLPNAGSMFKNPSGAAAGYLIEQAGLKGHRIGNAQISEKHANFIVNLGGASAHDVRALIALAQARVKEPLELEVQLVGDWDD